MTRRATPNATGLNRTLRHLRNRITPEHAAQVALAKALAAAVDVDPCKVCGAGQNAALWREYRAAVTDLLREVGAGDDLDDETARFRFEVQAPRGTTLVDPPQS